MANPQPDRFTRISNELLEAIYKYRISSREARVLLWVVRNSYGFQRKVAPKVGLRKMAEEINIDHANISRALRGLYRAGVLRETPDGIMVQKDYEGWCRNGTVAKSATDSLPNRQHFGAKSATDINKVVKDNLKEIKKKTPAPTERGSEIRLLISEFQLMLSKKVGEHGLINGGAAARGFKRLLASFPRHDIQSRLNAWFESTEPFLVNRCWRVEDFFSYFTRLKDGPIRGRENDRRVETDEERRSRIMADVKKREEHDERVRRHIAGK